MTDPSLVTRARERVRSWTEHQPATPYVREWEAVLRRSPDAIAAFLVDEGEHATELRQSTPFAGALEPRERWRIWRSVGERQ